MGRGLISFLLFVLVLGAGLTTYIVLTERDSRLLPAVAIVMAMMLTALPLLICYVQTISLQRQIAKLETLNDRSVSNTSFFKIAHNTLQSINPATLDRYYTFPMLTFAFVTIFCWLMTTVAYFEPDYFQKPSVILGGFHILSATDQADILNYQRGTFVAGCFGFIGAYIYTNWRLLDRIHNNDIYPISFYYYATRLLAACFIAGTVRHVLPDYGASLSVILLSFAIGFVPDIFITSIIRRASQVIKVMSDQPDPKVEVLPSNSSLLMIQGLDRDKIDRLAELYVTNAEILACQNPFILWLRLPYELLLIINWISQAQLYRIMKEEKFGKLRSLGICGSLDFVAVVSNPDASAKVAKQIGLAPEMLEAVISAIKADPIFMRLDEVQNALKQPFA